MKRWFMSLLSLVGLGAVLLGLLASAGCVDLLGLLKIPATVAGPASLRDEAYEVPSAATAGELLTFIDRLYQRTPSRQEQARYPDYCRRVLAACNQAADRVLAGEASEAERLQAVKTKCAIYRTGRAFGMPESRDADNEFLQTIARDANPQIARLGQRELLRRQSRTWCDLTDDGKTRVVQDLLSFVRDQVLEDRDLKMIRRYVAQLEIDRRLVDAREVYAAVIPALQRWGTPQAKREAEQYQARLRRLTLVGKELFLQGMLLSGSDLVWSTYRGRIVLVNFWASCCDPTGAQISQLKQAYQDYHGKGFDVVTVNLDSEQAADALVANQQIPWAVLYCDEKGDVGWEQSVVTQYGVWHLPESFLIDRDGKVVALSLQDQDLNAYLRAAFGEAA